MKKLQFFKNAECFEPSLQQPLSHGFAVTAPLTQWSLESMKWQTFSTDCKTYNIYLYYQFNYKQLNK
ncbi:MAG TPA: hypothetical protein DEQ52_06790 [Ruminococcaceae bacterium]|nr:hypothetical protein [Oscillospiraceae bacterium]